MHFHFDFNHDSNTKLFLYQQLEAIRLEKANLQARHDAMADNYKKDLTRCNKKKTGVAEGKDRTYHASHLLGSE